MDEARAEVVRLTPAQEQARVAEHNMVMAQRRAYLRTQALARIEEAKLEIAALDDEDRKTGFTLVTPKGPRKGPIQHLLEYARDLVGRMKRRQAFHFLKVSGVAAAFVLGGVFDVTCVKQDGTIRWQDNVVLNGITTQGMNHFLDVALHAATQKTTWYIALINNSPTPTLAVGDTYASHAGWSELTAYSQTNRVTWAVGAASSGSSTNATTSDFSMNATNTVYGLALVSASTKGDTAASGAILFATAAFSGGNQGVSNGDTLKVTYTVTGTPT